MKNAQNILKRSLECGSGFLFISLEGIKMLNSFLFRLGVLCVVH